MAGHGRQQLIARSGDATALAVLAQVGQHIAQQTFGLGVGQQRRDAAHVQRARSGAGDLESEGGQRIGLRLSGVGFALAHRQGDRHQQRLRLQADAIVCILQPLVADAFVRRMHVDHDQAFGILGQDVDAMQLGNGVTERGHPGVGTGDRQSVLHRHRR
ncbi:hypothetical protein D3C72_1848560 [compost metagenome]